MPKLTPEQDAEWERLDKMGLLNAGEILKHLGIEEPTQEEKPVAPKVTRPKQKRPLSSRARARIDVANEAAARKPFPAGHADEPINLNELARDPATPVASPPPREEQEPPSDPMAYV